MKIYQKIIVLFVLIVSFLSGVVILAQQHDKKQLQDIFLAEKKDFRSNFDKIIELKGKPLEKLVSTETYWDDLANFAVSGDLNIWPIKNVPAYLENSKINSLWVYSLDDKLLFSGNNINDPSIKYLPIQNNPVKNLFNSNNFCHFFIKTTKGLMEIRGATIHPSHDFERKTPPTGYLLAGLLWGNSYLNEISRLTGAELDVKYTPIIIKTKAGKEKSLEKEGIIEFSRNIHSWDGSQLARINVKFNSYIIQSAIRHTKNDFFSTLYFAIITSALILIVLFFWIDIPLLRISNALRKDDPEHLKRLKFEKGEFGDIALLIFKFLQQKNNLIEEISERRIAEKDLETSKDYAERILKLIPSAFFTVDNNKIITSWNDMAVKITGYSKEEIIGKPCDIFSKNFCGLNCELLNGGVEKPIFGKECTILSKSGKLLTILKNVDLLKDAEGNVIGGIESFIDITERKKTEDDIRSVKKQLEFILDSTNTGLDIIDSKYNLVYVNPSWAKLYGDYKGKKCHEYFADRKTICDGCGIPEAMRTKKIIISEEILPKENNRPIQVSTIPFQNASGEWFVAEVNVDITERKKYEKELIKSKIRFEQVAEQAREMIWEVDVNGLYIYVSSAVKNILGYEPEEIINKFHFYDLHPKEGLEEFKKEAFGVFEKKMLFKDYLNPALKKDGSIIWLSTNGAPILDENGDLLGYRGSDFDITERRLSERRIKESEEKYRALVENSPDLVFSLNEDGEFTFLNHIAAKELGGKPEDYIGKRISDIFIDEIAKKHSMAIKNIFKSGEAIAAEMPSVFHGENKWFFMNVQPVKDASGKVLSVLIIATDITKIKITENALRVSEEKYRLIFEQAANLIISFDKEGIIIDCNKQSEELLGFAINELIGLPASQIIHADYIGKFWESIGEAMSQGTSYNSESKLIAKTGNLVDVNINSSILKDKDGKYLRTILIFQDITRLKRTEFIINKINNSFLRFGPSSEENINILTGLVGEIFEAACAMYNRLENDMLRTVGQWNLPSDYKPVDKGIGHICYDVIKLSEGNPYFVQNLSDSKYAETDPSVLKYNLKTYLGKAVRCRGKYVGSICAVFEKDFKPTEEEKKFLGIIASAIGIEEERRLAKEEVMHAEERYAELVNNLNIGVYQNTPGPEGHFIDGNPAIVEMFEADSKEEFLGINVSDLYVNPAMRKEFSDKMLRQGFVKNETVELRTLRGKHFWASISAITKKNKAGDAYFDGILEDITERKEMEDMLRESQYQQKAILDNIPDIAWLKNEDGRFIAVNGPFAKACGRAPEDVVSRTDFDVWPVDFANKYSSDDKEVMETKKRRYIEEKVKQKSGEEIWVETIKTPIFDENGVVVGTAGIARDITARKNAEEALEEAYKKLKETQQELIQSEKLSAIGRLSSAFAHEVKNPLGIIFGGTEYLESELIESKEDIKLTIQKIKESVLRADNIVRSLMQFARPSDMSIEKIDPNGLIKETVALLDNKTRLSDIALKMELESGLLIEADKNQIHQVIFNIFVNALEATPKGGEIMIQTYKIIPKSGERASCVIEIMDKGIGISKENIGRIFEPFFTTKKEMKGVGLGLYTSKMIVEKFKGNIIVESDQWKWTKVIIYLPLVE